MWERYLTPVSLEEAVELLGQFGGEARIVAGTTDILLEMERGIRSGVPQTADALYSTPCSWVCGARTFIAARHIRRRATALCRASNLATFGPLR